MKPAQSASKHDADCMRRKAEMNFPYLCTCALTDAQVAVARVEAQIIADVTSRGSSQRGRDRG